MKNKMQDVRDHLVAMMEALNDKDVPPEMVDRARAVAGLAQAYTASVAIEIKAAEAAGVQGHIPEVLSIASVRTHTRPAPRLITRSLGQ